MPPSPQQQDQMPSAPKAQGLTSIRQSEPHGLSLNWDLKSLKVDAKIDWISLVLRLDWRSQQRHIRSRLVPRLGAGIFVEALSEEGTTTKNVNDTTSVFMVTIQDPQSAASILAAINESLLDDKVPLSASVVEVNAVEISLDVYTLEKQASEGVLAALVADLCLYRDSIPAVDKQLRIAGSKKARVKSGTVLYRDDIERHAPADVTVRSGNANLGREQRIYLKSKDTKPGNKHALLPPEKHCARFETTYRGEQRPFKTLEGWQTFKFESLRKSCFRWRIVEQDSPIAKASTRRLLLPLSRAEPGVNRRLGLSGTRIDQDFGQAVKNALERLTRAQTRRGSPRLNKK